MEVSCEGKPGESWRADAYWPGRQQQRQLSGGSFVRADATVQGHSVRLSPQSRLASLGGGQPKMLVGAMRSDPTSWSTADVPSL
jgi:hypothetical protein